MHRPVAAALVAIAALVLVAARADAQTSTAPCAPADLGCAVTSGLTNLATSLGATTTTVPAARSTTTSTTTARPAVAGLGAVSASSTGAVTATASAADALATVSPPAANPAQLGLPPLAIPDFGPPPVVARAPVVARRPVLAGVAAAGSARPVGGPQPSAADRALGACLASVVLLLAASVAFRHLPAAPRPHLAPLRRLRR